MLLQHAAQRLLHVPACAIVRAGGHASSVINLMFLYVLPACTGKFFLKYRLAYATCYTTGVHATTPISFQYCIILLH